MNRLINEIVDEPVQGELCGSPELHKVWFGCKIRGLELMSTTEPTPGYYVIRDAIGGLAYYSVDDVKKWMENDPKMEEDDLDGGNNF